MLETDSDAALEFDALIAVQVMGWIDNGFGDGIMEPGTCDPVIPHYSTNIADAWRVVEHLTRKGSAISYLSVILANGTATACIALYTRREPIQVTATTAPLAICRAALIAIKEIGQKL